MPRIQARRFYGRVWLAFGGPAEGAVLALFTPDGRECLVRFSIAADGMFYAPRIRQGTYVLMACMENFATRIAEVDISPDAKNDLIQFGLSPSS